MSNVGNRIRIDNAQQVGIESNSGCLSVPAEEHSASRRRESRREIFGIARIADDRVRRKRLQHLDRAGRARSADDNVSLPRQVQQIRVRLDSVSQTRKLGSKPLQALRISRTEKQSAGLWGEASGAARTNIAACADNQNIRFAEVASGEPEGTLDSRERSTRP